MRLTAGWQHGLVGAAVAATLAVSVFVVATHVEPLTVEEAVLRLRDERTRRGPAKQVAGSAPAASVPAETGLVSAAPTGAPPAASATDTVSVAPAATVPAGPSLLAEGVYIYDTKGGERLAVPGGDRRYPDTTTITVSHAGCGLRTRWDALQERWDADELCQSREGPLALRSFTSFHRFYMVSQLDDYVCDPDLLMAPPQEAPDTRWNGQCRSADTEVAVERVFVGRQLHSVGGKHVEAIRVDTRSTITGRTEGIRREKRWMEASSGLLLRLEVAFSGSTQGPAGSVDYHEAYELLLRRRDPVT